MARKEIIKRYAHAKNEWTLTFFTDTYVLLINVNSDQQINFN